MDFTEDAPQDKLQLTDITVTEEDMERAISEIKPNAATGPDGVPAVVLIKCSSALAQPLCILWRCSMDEGVGTTSTAEEGNHVPYIQGRRQEPAKQLQASNYHLIKVFEKCVRDRITVHMEEHHLHSDNQHGFRKGRSYLCKLLAHYVYCTVWLRMKM
ncbi:uncharacterized protein LOC135110596 [Scylla paramamosain]|uniref:uncharacterized protein LOC135110596 n=1 Tax=Scylla paramamosain TaxID=85552 RepID=UPI0030835DAF